MGAGGHGPREEEEGADGHERRSRMPAVTGRTLRRPGERPREEGSRQGRIATKKKTTIKDSVCAVHHLFTFFYCKKKKKLLNFFMEIILRYT